MTGVTNDHPLTWAYGQAVSHAACKNVAGTWKQFTLWVTQRPTPSPETMAEYAALPKADQANLKQSEWIVGGPVVDGHRTARAVPNRFILTVDIDRCSPGALDRLRRAEGFPRGWEYVGHTTRSSTPEAPRVRLYLPFETPLSPTDYRLAAQGFCVMLEVASMDDDGGRHITVDRAATTDVARLMYGPTLCVDAPHVPIVARGGFPDVGVLIDAGREAECARPQPRPHPERRGWDGPDDDLDARWREIMVAAGAVITQSPRRGTEETMHCPWHDDRNPSLDITADGKMVCRAGCMPGGSPITWLRFVMKVKGVDCESAAFDFARQSLGLPKVVRPYPQPGPDVFDDLEDGEAADEDVWGLIPLSMITSRRVLPEDRLWGEALTKGCVTLLTGQPGIGKSTLVRYLIAAVVDGHSYLGNPTRAQGAVAVIADYETPEVFRDSFWRDVYGEGITEVHNVFLTRKLPMVNADGAAMALIRELRAASCDLLVIDTISAGFLIDEENSNATMQEVARVLRRIAADAGVAALAIAHPSKGGADVRGGSALPAAIETIITYRAAKKLPAEGPSEDTEFLLTITKNRVGSHGSTIIRWDGLGGFKAPNAASTEDMLKADKVVAEIVAAHRPATISTPDIKRLASLEHVANRTAQDAIRRLVAAGMIRKIGRGNYG